VDENLVLRTTGKAQNLGWQGGAARAENSPQRSLMYTHKNGGDVGKPHPSGQREKPGRQRERPM